MKRVWVAQESGHKERGAVRFRALADDVPEIPRPFLQGRGTGERRRWIDVAMATDKFSGRKDRMKALWGGSGTEAVRDGLVTLAK